MQGMCESKDFEISHDMTDDRRGTISGRHGPCQFVEHGKCIHYFSENASAQVTSRQFLSDWEACDAQENQCIC